eukprot:m.1216177 g.1216177  ORF g.1216177 m.1216177 type:complete len:79 (+) comp24613_c0_seq14:1208-1444(+)
MCCSPNVFWHRASGVVHVLCPRSGPGHCIADALLVESQARYNDGSQVHTSVHVNAMDAIVLQRNPLPSGCVAPGRTVQ